MDPAGLSRARLWNRAASSLVSQSAGAAAAPPWPSCRGAALAGVPPAHRYQCAAQSTHNDSTDCEEEVSTCAAHNTKQHPFTGHVQEQKAGRNRPFRKGYDPLKVTEPGTRPPSQPNTVTCGQGSAYRICAAGARMRSPLTPCLAGAASGCAAGAPSASGTALLRFAGGCLPSAAGLHATPASFQFH